MTEPRILVTGATGRTGGAVVRLLLALGHRPRALVRRADARSDRLRQQGAEVAVADLFDPEQIGAALRGVHRAYVCPPFHPHMLHAAATFAAAAADARLESLVVLSQWLAGPSHPAPAARQHWLADRLFATLPGMAVTTLVPGFFASYPYLELLPYAAHLGVLPLPVDGDSRNAPPSDEDIGAMAVAALLDPGRHAGRIYRPTGPAMLSVRDMARSLGEVLGRPVRQLPLPLWMFLKAARMAGAHPFLLSILPFYLRDHSAGAFALGGPTDHVQEVTGRPPEDFASIARRYAVLPQARRSVGRSLRALGAFLAVPLRPGVNPTGYRHKLCLPEAAAPRLAMDDTQWRAERSAIAASARLAAPQCVPLRQAVPA